MADEEQDGNAEEKKGGKGKLIIFAVLGLVLVAGSVGATLFLTGFFDPPPPEEGEEGDVAAEPTQAPAMYFPIKPAFVVNFESRGRQRYLQADVTVMTRDQAVFSAIQNHLPLIKNRLVMVLSGELYEELQTDEGRELLRQKAMESIQQIVTDETGNEGGVEQVLFTNFVMQ